MVDIYQYSDATTFIRDIYLEKKRRNPRFGLRAWALKMGFKNHTPLALIINKKRKLSVRQISKISQGLGIPHKEKEYFETLAHFETAQDPIQKQFFLKILKEKNHKQDIYHLDLDQFHVISKWYGMALLEMTRLSGFQDNPEWMAKRLRHKVSVQEIKVMFERLQNLGLINQEKGKWIKTHQRLTTSGSLPNEGVRAHHKEVLDLAKEAIDAQSIEERLSNSFAITINQDQMSKAQELILDFRKRFSEAMAQSTGDSTYQMTIHFFELAKSQGHKSSKTPKNLSKIKE